MPATRTVAMCMTKSPITVQCTTSMAQALKLMEEHGIRHLPVVEGPRLLGLVSERELRVLENMRGVDTAFCTVRDFCTGSFYSVSPETPVREVARVMSEKKYGSAVVVDGEQVVGVFTTTDALRVLVEVLGAEESSSG
ncbi:MAG: CBS domain-containing protein [Polyangiaceae bacterium]|nr:CBS domain-containing protein [Polyangiaceae bacterium]